MSPKINISLLCVVCICTLLIKREVCFSQERVNTRYSLKCFIEEIHNASKHKSNGDDKTLVFFLRFVDFGCGICLNSFLDFCDTLNSTFKVYGKKDVILIFLRDTNEEAYQMKTLKRWAKASDLNFPIILVPQPLFDDYHIEYSSVLVLNSDSVPEIAEKLPLSPKSIQLLLKKIFK